MDSKEDEMFKKLGFKLVRNDARWIVYRNEVKDIDFSLSNATIEVENGMESKNITIEELQAINEKVKELGWIK